MTASAMLLPPARGPLTASLFPALAGEAALPDEELVAWVCAPDVVLDGLTDDDLQLALYVCYALHYEGIEGVDDRWEWEPGLLRVRRALEDRFSAELRFRTADLVDAALATDGDLADRLFALADDADGPSVAGFLQRRADADQLREFLVHRSTYNLRESDPQAMSLARLHGAPKVAWTELLFDEFGAGRPERLHSTLYARAMRDAGLDPAYGAYLHRVPGATLAVTNAMNLLHLHRATTAAAVGHFGMFEATSSEPSRRIAAGVARLGLPAGVAAYFDEHVEADAVHEQLALRAVCGGLATERPDLVPEILFGAAACLVTEAAAGEVILDAWAVGSSSLLPEPVELAS